MGKTVHTEAVQDLFEAILTLETEEECFNFFEDVCTVNELLSIAQRFAVAKMLKEHISGGCGEDRSVHSHDKQGQQIPELWQGRI